MEWPAQKGKGRMVLWTPRGAKWMKINEGSERMRLLLTVRSAYGRSSPRANLVHLLYTNQVYPAKPLKTKYPL